MASNRIVVDQTKQFGKLVAIAVDRLMDSRAEIARLKKSMDAATLSNDWPALAAELGLVAIGSYTASQQAQDLWTLFSNADTVLNGTAFVNGGTSSKAALDELYRADQG